MIVEIIGIVASIFILASLTFKCVSVKTNILMRILNGFGSLVFVVYGVLLLLQGGSAWSLVVCNGLLFLFNMYHLVRLCLTLKKKPADAQTDGAVAETEPAAENKSEE